MNPIQKSNRRYKLQYNKATKRNTYRTINYPEKCQKENKFKTHLYTYIH